MDFKVAMNQVNLFIEENRSEHYKNVRKSDTNMVFIIKGIPAKTQKKKSGRNLL